MCGLFLGMVVWLGPVDNVATVEVNTFGDQPRTAYEVAKGVKWATGSFDTFSSWMQRAAIGETLSHVEYLVIEGRLEKFMENGVQFYRKTA